MPIRIITNGTCSMKGPCRGQVWGDARLDGVRIQGASLGARLPVISKPGVTTVGKDNPGHFQPGIHFFRKVGVCRQGNNPGGEGHAGIRWSPCSQLSFCQESPPLSCGAFSRLPCPDIHDLGIPPEDAGLAQTPGLHGGQGLGPFPCPARPSHPANAGGETNGLGAAIAAAVQGPLGSGA